MQRNESTFTRLVDEYIKEKRATGYGFEKGTQVLRRIVFLQNEVDHDLTILSTELANRWAEKTAWENDTNRGHRISVLRGLGAYMVRMGYDAYVVSKHLAPEKDYENKIRLDVI